MDIKSPDGKFMGTVKVGPKGQIVIPKEVREMFSIEPGQSLVLLADRDRGIALQQPAVLDGIADAIFAGKGGKVLPREDPAGYDTYARSIKKVTGGEDKKK